MWLILCVAVLLGLFGKKAQQAIVWAIEMVFVFLGIIAILDWLFVPFVVAVYAFITGQYR